MNSNKQLKYLKLVLAERVFIKKPSHLSLFSKEKRKERKLNTVPQSNVQTYESNGTRPTGCACLPLPLAGGGGGA